MGETAYLLANASVLPFWLAMIFAPRAELTRKLVSTPLVPVIYAALYAVLVSYSLVFPAGGSMASLGGLRQAFTSDVVLLMAWVHYLCFDMFVGMWEVRDAERHGISGPLLGICLFFTLMLGPSGMLLYFAVRSRRVGIRFDAD